MAISTPPWFSPAVPSSFLLFSCILSVTPLVGAMGLFEHGQRNAPKWQLFRKDLRNIFSGLSYTQLHRISVCIDSVPISGT